MQEIKSEYIDNEPEHILLYGQVQGGKTKSIIELIKKSPNDYFVIVVQNSLLVLNQYKERLTAQDISFIVIDKYTIKVNKKCNVMIVMNNVYRYRYFNATIEKNLINENYKNGNYTLILDESDLTIRNCPLRSKKTYHVTATPFNSFGYNKVIKIPFEENYYDISKLNVNIYSERNEYSEIQGDDNIIRNFLKKEGKQMMLINKYNRVKIMTEYAEELTIKYKEIPIVLLTSHRYLYLNGKKKVLSRSITKIIDSLSKHSHIIFIANRLSDRGLSYTSSDYSRHLTHQIARVRPNMTSFIQSLRILGIYNDNPELNIYIHEDQEILFKKHIDKYLNFDTSSKLQ
jgi:hypothetical protein